MVESAGIISIEFMLFISLYRLVIASVQRIPVKGARKASSTLKSTATLTVEKALNTKFKMSQIE